MLCLLFSITRDAYQSAVLAFDLSCIGDVKSLLYIVRSKDLMQLQRLQNKTTLLIFTWRLDESCQTAYIFVLVSR